MLDIHIWSELEGTVEQRRKCYNRSSNNSVIVIIATRPYIGPRKFAFDKVQKIKISNLLPMFYASFEADNGQKLNQ